MSATVEIKRFWIFRHECGCTFGVTSAYRRPLQFLVTEEQAWSSFYYGRKRERNVAEKAGAYVTAEDDMPPLEEFSAQSHIDGVCTRTAVVK